MRTGVEFTEHLLTAAPTWRSSSPKGGGGAAHQAEQSGIQCPSWSQREDNLLSQGESRPMPWLWDSRGHQHQEIRSSPNVLQGEGRATSPIGMERAAAGTWCQKERGIFSYTFIQLGKSYTHPADGDPSLNPLFFRFVLVRLHLRSQTGVRLDPFQLGKKILFATRNSRRQCRGHISIDLRVWQICLFRGWF